VCCYNVIFLIQRLAFCILVFLFDEANVQIQPWTMISAGFFMYTVFFSPFKQRLYNIVDSVN
jgi:hypothetical protein